MEVNQAKNINNQEAERTDNISLLDRLTKSLQECVPLPILLISILETKSVLYFFLFCMLKSMRT